MFTGSVVIVTYNSAECIVPCLQALTWFADWKIVVVDNASTDATVQVARRIVPQVCLLCNSENRGFAGAVNQGIKAAEGDVVVILNADAIPAEGALERMARLMAEKGVGVVGGSLRKSDGSVERGFTVRRFPTVTSTVAEVLLLNRVWPNNPWNRRYRCLGLDYSKLQEVEQPAGACLAIRRQAWEDVGGLDENFYPVWFEDVDFCRRVTNGGWRILYCPDAVFMHRGAHSVGKLSFRDRQLFWYRNLLRYFAKHYPGWRFRVVRVSIVFGLMVRSVLAALGVRPAGVSAREALAAYRDAAWQHAVGGRDLAARQTASLGRDS